MSKVIKLDTEITRCEDCEVYEECTSKQMHTHKCLRKIMRDNFGKIYNDDTEEDDDV